MTAVGVEGGFKMGEAKYVKRKQVSNRSGVPQKVGKENQNISERSGGR